MPPTRPGTRDHPRTPKSLNSPPATTTVTRPSTLPGPSTPTHSRSKTSTACGPRRSVDRGKLRSSIWSGHQASLLGVALHRGQTIDRRVIVCWTSLCGSAHGSRPRAAIAGNGRERSGCRVAVLTFLISRPHVLSDEAGLSGSAGSGRAVAVALRLRRSPELR